MNILHLLPIQMKRQAILFYPELKTFLLDSLAEHYESYDYLL